MLDDGRARTSYARGSVHQSTGNRYLGADPRENFNKPGISAIEVILIGIKGPIRWDHVFPVVVVTLFVGVTRPAPGWNARQPILPTAACGALAGHNSHEDIRPRRGIPRWERP